MSKMNDSVLLNECSERENQPVQAPDELLGCPHDVEEFQQAMTSRPRSTAVQFVFPYNWIRNLNRHWAIDTQDLFCSAGSGLSLESGRVEVYVAELNFFSHSS